MFLGVMKISKLTPKQKRFADEYIISGNATDAAIKAGYSEKTAGITGHENLKKPNIQNYIKNKTKAKTEKMEYNIETVIEKLYETAYGIPQKVPFKVFNNLTQEWEVDEIKTVIPSVKDQNQARDMLMKITGQYIDRKQIEMTASHSINNPFEKLTDTEIKQFISKADNNEN